MIKIYNVPEALESILKRQSAQEAVTPPAMLERLEKVFGPGATPVSAVAEIVQTVRLSGDAALRRWSAQFDRFTPETFRIPAEELEKAYRSLDRELADALCQAVDRIRRFHELQPIPSWESHTMGGMLGQRFTPVKSAGVYVPGGSAPLPSSLLMSAIPAKVAGVERVIVCTPPGADPTILAAAYLAGVEEVYQAGGAQAIAAMAFGTESIPRVDKIVGAGNLFVTLAKQQVYGVVGLDGLAGPTETVVIADETANPAWVAADLLAQAEHDILASAILLTPSQPLAEAVQAELSRQFNQVSRQEILKQSLAGQSGIVLTRDLDEALQLANDYAPEHLCLSVANPAALAPQVRNAGGLFIGEGSFEVLGDYIAGPSHVMPTGGTARFASPLNVLDFVKITNLIGLDEQSSRELSKLAVRIAEAESLSAHAAAARLRAGTGRTEASHV